MTFTDIFIKRPVLSMVVSLLIFFAGLSCIEQMPVSEYPKVESATITVTTTYSGASAELIAGFITSPIEKSVATAEGIDYLTSSSDEGSSTITAYLKLNYDATKAFMDIMAKTDSVENELPSEAQNPVITKANNESTDLMYIALSSTEMNQEQINDYAYRIVAPKIETVNGVSSVSIFGNQKFAMRIFLDPFKMAAFNLTANDVKNALSNNNYKTAVGNSKGEYVDINLHASTDLSTSKGFNDIVLKQTNNALIRLKDVSKTFLGSVDYNSSSTFNGAPSIMLGITQTPAANPITVAQQIRQLWPSMQKNFPNSLKGTIVYDATTYINESIQEVLKTLLEAALIVVLVILAFLGSFRSVLIPMVTIPLSLVGVFTLMYVLGFSINLLTLLALVLAIGLVVDDAIVVVENVHRHMEEGLSPTDSALKGAREIAVSVITMTTTLAAVYAPIGLLGGVTGALFKQFAFTLACSVIISGVIALTLSPMMCSKILTEGSLNTRFAKIVDQSFERFKQFYRRLLVSVIASRSMIVMLAITVLVSSVFLYINTSKETAPEEDQGFFMLTSSAPQTASINFMEAYTHQFESVLQNLPGAQDHFIINKTGSSAISGVVLKPWSQRKVTTFELKSPLQQKANDNAGLQTYAITPPPLPGGGGGAPINFVITTDDDFATLYEIAEKVVAKGRASGKFLFLNNALKYDNPQVTLNINRAKSANLGLNMADIGKVLSGAMSGNYVNYMSINDVAYKVIPQLDRRFRLNPAQINQIYIKTSSGLMVPLSTVATLSEQVLPNSLTHFQQLNSATINGVLAPKTTIGDGLAELQNIANQTLPKGFTYNYGGQSRQYIQEGSSLVKTFFLAILVIFLILSAQFESFRDPLTILVSVPLSICGALIPLNLGFATINIYTQVGLITLVGLISKHGILIVNFANQLQMQEGMDIKSAVIEAATVRLRAILMTTAAMVLGVAPLLTASGAGAISRFDIGLVIATGMLVGTCFTLFVVPVMYTFFAKRHTQIV